VVNFGTAVAAFDARHRCFAAATAFAAGPLAHAALVGVAVLAEALLMNALTHVLHFLRQAERGPSRTARLIFHMWMTFLDLAELEPLGPLY